MFKYTSFVITALVLSTALHAQERPGKVTFYGLDYTQVKFIGLDEDFSDLFKIQNTYFAAWNGLFLTEQSKYNVATAFNVREVEYTIEKAIKRSEDRDMTGIVQRDSYSLGKEELASVLKAYIIPGEDKVGTLFIMETLNKFDKVSTMWLVVFNVSDGTIHHLKRYSGGPGGFGFRNYWARGYYNVLNGIRDSKVNLF
jgi:hypothetical protein